METRIALETRRVLDIDTNPTFEQLFPIRDDLLEKIETDMREGTYDLSQPVILATWDGQKKPVCIDGHTRMKAAINAGIDELPVFTHEFNSEQEAIEKAIKLQQNRRNLSDADILTCIAVLDSKRSRGGDRRSPDAKSKASSDAIEYTRSKSAAATADLLGISTTKVERSRNMLANADQETIDEVKEGKKSIHKATKEIREKRKKKPSGEKTKKKQSIAPCLPAPEPEAALGEEAKESIEDDCATDTGQRMLPISEEYYLRLKELGGPVEDHVAHAIEYYLEMMRAKNDGKTSNDIEYGEDYFDDGDYDD
jgi:hypothetical protein